MNVDIRPFSGQMSWRRGAFPLQIDKSLIERLIEQIRDGKPIEVPTAGWSANELLLVAGVCAWAAAERTGGILGDLHRDEFLALPKERQEAYGQAIHDNVPAATLFVATMVHNIASDKYDRNFAPILEGCLYVEDDTVVFEVASGR